MAIDAATTLKRVLTLAVLVVFVWLLLALEASSTHRTLATVLLVSLAVHRRSPLSPLSLLLPPSLPFPPSTSPPDRSRTFLRYFAAALRP